MSCVDVIIPCYKYAHFLRDCVESVLSQEGVDIRILILDDCSPDNTPEVAAELQQQDSRIEYRRHEKNQGHIATYNEGLEWTNGDYVMLLSADDLLTPGALARSARLMNAHPEVGLVYSRDIPFESGQLPPYSGSASSDCRWQILTYQEFLEKSCMLGHTPIQAPATIARTAVHKVVGGYRKELPHTADTEIWLRLAASSAVGVLDTEQAYRRLHQQNMSLTYSTPQRLLEQKKAFDAHFRWCGDRLPASDRLSRLLDHVLAENALWGASNAFDQGDQRACQDFLRLAVDLNPVVRYWPLWFRLRIKQFLGPRVWSLVQPTVDRFRKLICYRSTVY